MSPGNKLDDAARGGDFRARDLELGGAVGSLYDRYQASGTKVFARAIGAVRARQPRLRQSRTLAGGCLYGVLIGGGVCAAFALVVSIVQSSGVWDTLGAMLGGIVVGTLLGSFLGLGLARVVLWYVEYIRDEHLRPSVHQELNAWPSYQKMQKEIAGLDVMRRGRYYDAYLNARAAGLEPDAAHSLAIGQP